MYTMRMAGSYILVNNSSTKIDPVRIIKMVEGENFQLKNKPENNPDLMEIDLEEEKRSIGIASAKLGIKFVSERPYQEKHRYLIIYNADKLTVEAQNSLLKTLEEPPEHTIIFLVTRSSGALLDTISSRCKKLSLLTDFKEKVLNNTRELLGMTIGERLAFAEELAKEDKQFIINYLTELAKTLSKTGDISYPKALAIKLQNISSKINDLDNTNVATRLALEDLFMNI